MDELSPASRFNRRVQQFVEGAVIEAARSSGIALEIALALEPEQGPRSRVAVKARHQPWPGGAGTGYASTEVSIESRPHTIES